MINKRTVKSGLIIHALVFILLYTSCNATRSENLLPSIVIVFVDDVGYGDLGCFGATGFETPNIDRLAGEGMRFTNFYSGSAVCSPSRAALLTGCYPPRVGITRVLFPHDSIGITPKETTIAELLKGKDYTTAIYGKWHLGHLEEFLPDRHGFDDFFGLPYSNDMWPVHYNGLPVSEENNMKRWKLDCPPLQLFEGNGPIEEIASPEDQEKITTLYTERAVNFIERNRKGPFFLIVSHTMAHVPLAVSDKFKGKSEQGLYGDVMMEIDWSVGEILKALSGWGIEKNTLVIFTSDNGPALIYGNHAGSAGGLREGIGTPFEGGFRVPCVMRWPGIIPSGTLCNQIAGAIDLLPTIAEISGTGLPAKEIDGISIWPLLRGDFSKTLQNEYCFYSGNSLDAVRQGNWKIVNPHPLRTNVGSQIGKDGWPGEKLTTDFPGGLYDLRRDPGERYNMQAVYPEILENLKELANEMQSELGDREKGFTGAGIREP